MERPEFNISVRHHRAGMPPAARKYMHATVMRAQWTDLRAEMAWRLASHTAVGFDAFISVIVIQMLDNLLIDRYARTTR